MLFIMRYQVFCSICLALAVLDCLGYLPQLDVGSHVSTCGLWDGLGSAIVSGIGSLFGGLFGASAQEDANWTNLVATRETNQMNRDLFNQQLGFTERMWNENNAYNTPFAQRARYEQAGINPYMMMGNVSSGNAQTATTPSPNAMIAPHVDPVNYMSGLESGVLNAVDTYTKVQQAESISLDNQSKLINLRYQEAEKNLDLKQRRAELENKRVQSAYTRQQIRSLDRQIAMSDIQLKYYDDQLNADTEGKKEMSRKAKHEADEAYWKADYAEQMSRAFPQLNQAQLRLLGAQAYSAYQSGESSKAQKGLTEAMTETEAQKKLGQILENGIKANQFTLEQLQIPQAQLDALKAGKLKEYYEKHPNARRFDQSMELLGKRISELSPIKFGNW